MIKHEYILEVINKDGRLIIPDLGAFLTKENHETGEKTVFFNDVLKYNDGKLINYISEIEGIDCDVAKINVKQFVDEIQNSLISSNMFVINNLGYFYKDAKGYVNFKMESNIVNEVALEEKTIEAKIEETPKEEKSFGDEMLEITNDPIQAVKNVNIEESISIDNINQDEMLEIIDDSDIPSANEILDTPSKEEIKYESPTIERIKEEIPEFEKPIDAEEIEDKPIVEQVFAESINKEIKQDINEPQFNTEKEQQPEHHDIVSEFEAFSSSMEESIKDEMKNLTPKKSSSAKTYIIISAIVIPIAAAGVFGYLYFDSIVKYYHKFTGKYDQELMVKNDTLANKQLANQDSLVAPIESSAAVNEEKVEDVSKVESNEKVIAENKSIVAEEQPQVKEVKAENTKKTSTALSNQSGNKFHVIAGSFNEQSMAENYAEKMRTQGFNSTVLAPDNGKIRVTYGSFSTREAAVAELENVKAKGMQGWLLTK